MSEPDRLTNYQPVTAHVAEGLALLPGEFQKPVIRALATSYLAEVQLLEDAIWTLLVDGIVIAVGAQLDQLGAIVRQARSGLGDSDYREVLRAAILANRSAATGDELQAIAAILLAGTSPVLTESFPGAIVVEPTSTVVLGAPLGAAILKRATAVGVRLILVDPPTGYAFMFATGDVPEADSVYGLSDDTSPKAGKWATAVEGLL